MKVDTTRFGPLEIDESKIISFPGGIPGFENLRRFCILPVEGSEDLKWMQSLEESAVALLITDPFVFFKDYTCDIPAHDVEELELKEPSEAMLVTVITVPRDNPGGTTANLVAPVIINTRLNRAKQVILTGSPYTTRHRLFPGNSPTPPEKGTEAVMAGEGL